MKGAEINSARPLATSTRFSGSLPLHPSKLSSHFPLHQPKQTSPAFKKKKKKKILSAPKRVLLIILSQRWILTFQGDQFYETWNHSYFLCPHINRKSWITFFFLFFCNQKCSHVNSIKPLIVTFQRQPSQVFFHHPYIFMKHCQVLPRSGWAFIKSYHNHQEMLNPAQSIERGHGQSPLSALKT